MDWEIELDRQKLDVIYEWIDRIPLSRQKKRIEGISVTDAWLLK